MELAYRTRWNQIRLQARPQRGGLLGFGGAVRREVIHGQFACSPEMSWAEAQRSRGCRAAEITPDRRGGEYGEHA